MLFQVEFIRNLEDRDDHYQSVLNDKLQLANDTGLSQLYSEEQDGSLVTN